MADATSQQSDSSNQQAGTQQAGTQQAGTQQADTQQADTQQAGTQQAGTQQADTQQADTQQADTQQADPAPKDWAAIRTEIAGDDEKLLKRLSRYGSVKDVADALIAAQNKIASGTLKAALPADATPEQLAEWRTENGIPESPEKYDTTLPDGMVVGEFDKPVVDGFTKTAHELNLTPAQVKSTLAWYFKQQEQQVTELRQADAAFSSEANEKLREEWGSEYKLNTNLIDSLLTQMPEDGKTLVLGARLADGTPLGGNPKVLRWLANLAREVNPTATVVPGSGTNSAQAIESELANITKLMGDRNSEYWKGPTAEKMQARYRDLVDVQNKLRK